MIGAALSRAAAQHDHSTDAADDHARARRRSALASLLPYVAARARPLASPGVTMIGAGLGVRLERRRDQARRRRPLAAATTSSAAAWGAVDRAAPRASGVLSEMSALQSRPAIQVAPVVFVTQTVVPVVLAPLLLGESFAATPLGGVPLVAVARGAGRAAPRARALAAAARADGRRARQRAERLDAEPLGRQPGDDPLEPEQRGRRAVEVDDDHVARAHRALRQRRRSRSMRSAPLTGVAPAVRASTSCPTDSPPRGCR